MSRWPASNPLELVYSRIHPGIPVPRLGYEEDWTRHHAHLPEVKLDHRACPAIIGRQHMGITVSMPYTLRLFRDGRLQVEMPWLEDGPKIQTWKPEQGVVGIGEDGEQSFPGYEIVMTPTPNTFMRLFALGDIQVGTWVLDTGVAVMGLPSDHAVFISPLPNHVYPPTYSVGQAVGNPRLSQGMFLRIAIDFHLPLLPPDEEAIVVPYGKPMCQYLPVQLPVVKLRPSDEDTAPAGKVG